MIIRYFARGTQFLLPFNSNVVNKYKATLPIIGLRTGELVTTNPSFPELNIQRYFRFFYKARRGKNFYHIILNFTFSPWKSMNALAQNKAIASVSFTFDRATISNCINVDYRIKISLCSQKPYFMPHSSNILDYINKTSFSHLYIQMRIPERWSNS